MNKYTPDTTFTEIFHEPDFCAWRHMLDYRPAGADDSLEKMTLAQHQFLHPDWNAQQIADGFSYLYECVQKDTVFHSFWGDIELEREPAKRATGLAAFTLPEKSKFVLICPGGGYGCVCSLLEGYPLARTLNEMGYAAFVVRYRVGKDAKCYNCLDDIAAALRYIFDHADQLKIDTTDYAVIGFSAGAHIVGCFGLENLGYKHFQLAKPGALFLCYPVVTMGKYSHAGSRNNLFGDIPQTDDLLTQFSIEKNVTPTYPPTYIWQCFGDPMVPIENSMLLVQALRHQDISCCYEVFPYTTHGLPESAADYAKAWIHRAVEFWNNL